MFGKGRLARLGIAMHSRIKRVAFFTRWAEVSISEACLKAERNKVHHAFFVFGGVIDSRVQLKTINRNGKQKPNSGQRG